MGQIITVNMLTMTSSNKNELKILLKIIKCNTLQFSEVNVLFSYRTVKCIIQL
jgi:hypothetical protein